jgi:salicylate hydroxylase
MRVIIAGGGIGGMAAAIAVKQAGFDPIVLEQAPEIAEVGAGVGLAANAMRALEFLGAAAHVRTVSTRASEIILYAMDTGANISHTRLDPSAFGDYMYLVHRADLLNALMAQLPRECIRTNSRVVSFEETSSGVSVRLDRDEVLHGASLIGADGLQSVVRAGLYGKQAAIFTGYVGWRAIFPAARAPHIKAPADARLWAGPNRHVVFYPLRKGELLNGVFYVPAGEVHRESWTLSGDVSDLRASFTDACPEVRQMVESVEQAFISAIYFREPLSAWSTPRISLIGDAAHPILPTAGQGAAMALEDAVTLGMCLRRHGNLDFAAALKEYEARRLPRTARVQILSRSNLASWQESDPEKIRARDGRYRGLMRLDPYGKIPWSWMYKHDVVAAGNKPLEELRAESAQVNPLRRPEARQAFDQWQHALTPQDNARGWIGQREGYARFFKNGFAPPSSMQTEALDCDGVAVLKVGKGAIKALHLHGGAYVLGSAACSVELASRIALGLGGAVLVPDYRLAPEHPYPAAFDDAMTVYRWIARQPGGARVAVTGESSGGGLALAIALAARDRGEPLPRMLWLNSPLCDLSLSAESIRINSGKDAWLSLESLTMFAASYLQDGDPHDPLLSPLHGDLQGLPPMLIHAVEDELLVDDARRLAAKAEKAGVDVRLQVVEDSVHSFILFASLPEAAQALQEFTDMFASMESRQCG